MNNNLVYCYRKWKGRCDNNKCPLWWGCLADHIHPIYSNGAAGTFKLQYAPFDCASKSDGYQGVTYKNRKDALKDGWI